MVRDSRNSSSSSRAPMVPMVPTRWPAARNAAASRYKVVVLPLVPVMAYVDRRLAGCPYTPTATSAMTIRGSSTTTTGTPRSASWSAPAGSVSTATAPARTASWANRAPWVVRPGTAAYRSPGITDNDETVTPVTGTVGAAGSTSVRLTGTGVGRSGAEAGSVTGEG